MGIPSQQIGWSTKARLMWQILKQVERLNSSGAAVSTTTTTTTILP